MAYNLKRSMETTALMMAAEEGHTECVQALINAGAKLDHAGNDCGDTALMRAAWRGQAECMQTLIDAGAGPLRLPFYVAVNRLLEAKADVNLANNYGVTALTRATSNWETSAVNRLIEANANVNLVNEGGCTALILAADNGHKRVVDCLLKANADVNLTNKNGATALELATQSSGAQAAATIQNHIDEQINHTVKSARKK